MGKCSVTCGMISSSRKVGVAVVESVVLDVALPAFEAATSAAAAVTRAATSASALGHGPGVDEDRSWAGDRLCGSGCPERLKHGPRLPGPDSTSRPGTPTTPPAVLVRTAPADGPRTCAPYPGRWRCRRRCIRWSDRRARRAGVASRGRADSERPTGRPATAGTVRQPASAAPPAKGSQVSWWPGVPGRPGRRRRAAVPSAPVPTRPVAGGSPGSGSATGSSPGCR